MAEISPFIEKPSTRETECEQIRSAAIESGCELGHFPRPTNGDEERFSQRLGNFSKALPHGDLGEVVPEFYDALLAALRSGEFKDMEALRLGGTSKLLNPLGGLAFNIEGPDSPFDGLVPAPPAFSSAELAGQMAELYWMAVCRDVPFRDYGTDSLIAEAAEDLHDFPGYENVTPQTLFRMDLPGTQDGPIVSQFLLKDFRYDGILVEARTRVPEPVQNGTGIDFLTTFEEWLCAQRGFPAEGNPFNYPVCERGEQVFAKTPRFIHSVRDMGQNAGQDSIYSAYFRAARVLADLDGNGTAAPVDPGNPYAASLTQNGFATFGSAHQLLLVGTAHKAERHTWYQKWNMHRFLRPEAFGGRVHNMRTGAAHYPIHQRLLDSPVLERIFAYNRKVNRRREIDDTGSYLLPILFPGGGPTHPSYPAGHAFSAGACVTMLKAWFNTVGDGDFEIPEPCQPSRDGRSCEPYRVGKDGPPLTVGGELNKLAHNLSRGRDMSGVHWLADDIAGLRQGEEVAIRILREARATYPEPFAGFTLTKFDGTTVIV